MDRYREAQTDKTNILFTSRHLPLNLSRSTLHSRFLAATTVENRAVSAIDSESFISHGIEKQAPNRGHFGETFWLPMLETRNTPGNKKKI